uniref:Uncharacterized protein n=1 Tax=Arundo donax TaxID=35708 RepID=A0A0A9FUE8_ARUDO
MYSLQNLESSFIYLALMGASPPRGYAYSVCLAPVIAKASYTSYAKLMCCIFELGIGMNSTVFSFS